MALAKAKKSIKNQYKIYQKYRCTMKLNYGIG